MNLQEFNNLMDLYILFQQKNYALFKLFFFWQRGMFLGALCIYRKKCDYMTEKQEWSM